VGDRIEHNKGTLKLHALVGLNAIEVMVKETCVCNRCFTETGFILDIHVSAINVSQKLGSFWIYNKASVMMELYTY
jgi:hypothetical protein